MSDETERALRDWPNQEMDTQSLVHEHFESVGDWDWCEIVDEARRIFPLAFDVEVEPNSAIDLMLLGVAAQSADGAFAAVAAFLGVDARALKSAVAPWYENQRSLPPPVGIAGIEKEIAASEEFLRSLAQRGPGLPVIEPKK